jgi:hypothetical protein
LGRELFYKKGLAPEPPAITLQPQKWLDEIETEAEIKTGGSALFIDEATCNYCAGFAPKLNAFLRANQFKIALAGIYDTGFSLLAVGRIDDGIKVLEQNASALNKSGVKRVITLSGLSHYCLTTLADEFEIKRDFETANILSLLNSVFAKEAYAYGGSFYCRYLKMGALIESLTKNAPEKEKVVPNSREFQPVLEGDKRVNRLNIWQPPVCAEFFNPGSETGIFERAAAEIASVSHSELVIFDPMAYNAFNSKKSEANKVKYFLDLIG